MWFGYEDELMAVEVIQIQPPESPQIFWGRSLSKDGLEVDLNIVGDYSASPQEFSIKPNPGESVYITDFRVYVEDAGSFDTGFYGNGIVLNNGIHLSYLQDENLYYLTNPAVPVITSGDLGSLMDTIKVHKWGSGNEFLIARYSFYDRARSAIHLSGDKGDKFIATFNDDFTKLVKHRFAVSGFTINKQ